MALSNNRLIFGVHSVTPYNITTGEGYGLIRVLDSSSVAVNSELISLTGGSQRFPFGVENGVSSAEISLNMSQYDNFLFEIAYGAKPTKNAAQAGGSCSTLTNKSGSLVDATTGIASVSVEAGEEDELKFSKFVVKAVTSTTVDVYASSDIDFARGTDGSFENDLLKITSTPLTIADTGATVSLAGYGVEFTSGSGTVDLTVGDTATFETQPINSESSIVTIGGTSDVIPEIGLICYSQARGNGELVELDIFRVKLSGLPFGFNKYEWSTAEISGQAFYDSNRNGVMSMRHVIPS